MFVYLPLKQLQTPDTGHFIAPCVIRVDDITQMKREIFGPVLHLATFEAEHLDATLKDIADTGYGLTFGLHTRIDDRVQHIVESLPVGNIYVNRNQIGAIVGSQPFGGEGLSGTGPKAGGPDYLSRFTAPSRVRYTDQAMGEITAATLQARIDAAPLPVLPPLANALPGPTGESNRLTRHARAPLLCLGPGAQACESQARAVQGLGGRAVEVTEPLEAEQLLQVQGYSGVIWWGGDEMARDYVRALAQRDGAILPLLTGALDATDALLERHVCVDTTASGGNAELLAAVSI